MYNIKGPNKIMAKTTTRRGGISQNIDNYRDHNKNKITDEEQNDAVKVPIPTFCKKPVPNNQRNKNISPEHEEIINFIHDSWSSVCAELDQENGDSDENTNQQCKQTIYYYEEEPCTSLQNFKPFDLESWWGKRLYSYITSSVSKG